MVSHRKRPLRDTKQKIRLKMLKINVVPKEDPQSRMVTIPNSKFVVTFVRGVGLLFYGSDGFC